MIRIIRSKNDLKEEMQDLFASYLYEHYRECSTCGGLFRRWGHIHEVESRPGILYYCDAHKPAYDVTWTDDGGKPTYYYRKKVRVKEDGSLYEEPEEVKND